jgi:hypothetical protein
VLSIALFKGWLVGLIITALLPFIAIFNLKYWILFVKTKGTWKYTLDSKSEDIISMKNEFKKICSLMD